MGKDKVVLIDLTPPNTVYILFKRGSWPQCHGRNGYSSSCYIDPAPHRAHSVLCYDNYDEAVSGATEGDLIVAFNKTNNYQLKMVPV